MANVSAPVGFQPSRNYSGAAPTFQTNRYPIAYNNTHTFGAGDVVKILSTGYVDRALTSDTAFLGVVQSVEWVDSITGKVIRNSWTAPSTAVAGTAYAYVYTDPLLIFRVQSGNGGPVTVANIGNNINFGGNAAPTTAGISVAYADFATIATTATLPFRIIGFGNQINDDPTTAYNWIEVIANPGAWTATSGTGI